MWGVAAHQTTTSLERRSNTPHVAPAFSSVGQAITPKKPRLRILRGEVGRLDHRSPGDVWELDPPLYHRRVEPKRDDLTAAWVWTQARLPEGWSLDSLRCASIGLQADQRSDDWIAVAVGPDGADRTYRAADAFAALAGLADLF